MCGTAAKQWVGCAALLLSSQLQAGSLLQTVEMRPHCMERGRSVPFVGVSVFLNYACAGWCRLANNSYVMTNGVVCVVGTTEYCVVCSSGQLRSGGARHPLRRLLPVRTCEKKQQLLPVDVTVTITPSKKCSYAYLPTCCNGSVGLLSGCDFARLWLQTCYDFVTVCSDAFALFI